MTLPILTTEQDAFDICTYLLKKPTGATLSEAKAVVNERILDARKISAYKCWGIIEDQERLKLTDLGRMLAKDAGVHKAGAYKVIIKNKAPYSAVIEQAHHQELESISANDVAANWHDHFKDQVAANESTLNGQAIAFFHVAMGGDLGELIIGRRGAPTRFKFNRESVAGFVDEANGLSNPETANQPAKVKLVESPDCAEPPHVGGQLAPDTNTQFKDGNKVFITHGSDAEIVAQLKEILKFGNFEPVVCEEIETATIPVPYKVMDAMSGCSAAIIHVGQEGRLMDASGKEVITLNQNVLIEIGAAMALYRDHFILLVANGVRLPSNLQGLYEVRYTGEKLDYDATMKLLKAFNGFRTQPVKL